MASADQFDWNYWITTSGVKSLLSKLSALRNQRWDSGRVMESYPRSIKYIPQSAAVIKVRDQRFDICESAGYVEASIGLRDTRVKNYKTHYPDYEGAYKAVNLNFFQRHIKRLPDPRSDFGLSFHLSLDRRVVVSCHHDVSMGITQDGRAGGLLVVEFDDFYSQYAELYALTSKRGGNFGPWKDWRIQFERYVASNDNFEMTRWWGKKYAIVEEHDEPTEHIPF